MQVLSCSLENELMLLYTPRSVRLDKIENHFLSVREGSGLTVTKFHSWISCFCTFLYRSHKCPESNPQSKRVHSKSKDSVEAFLEEAVVRRELADNFCFYNLENYDSIKGTNAWAQKTLHDHAQDKREYLYTREELENGNTHDDLWNAAQVCGWWIIFMWG